MLSVMTTFYLGLIVLCGGFIALSFLVGELADFAGSLSDGVSDLLDSIGHVADAIGGAAHAGDVDAPHFEGADHPGGEAHTPSPFSLRTISMFGAGFGAGGLLGKGLGLTDIASLVPAVGTGTIAGALMYVFMRYVYGSVGTTSIGARDYVGLICRVSVPIPANGAGGISVVVKGQMKNIPAITADGAAVPAHAEVAIVAMDGGTAVVEPLQPTANQGRSESGSI
ncbi:MAG: hypothetical protein ACYC5O_23840 [Anaerolineae bacterium]